jgi:hypothetical protein
MLNTKEWWNVEIKKEEGKMITFYQLRQATTGRPSGPSS